MGKKLSFRVAGAGIRNFSYTVKKHQDAFDSYLQLLKLNHNYPYPKIWFKYLVLVPLLFTLINSKEEGHVCSFTSRRSRPRKTNIA